MFPKPVFSPVGRVSGPVAPNSRVFENVFLFDLETLTDSRNGVIEFEFASYLAAFAGKRPCYLLSRTNYNEVMRRVPARVLNSLAGVFTNAGSELWVKNELQIRHEHDLSDDLYEFAAKVVQKSTYPDKRAPMIDCGPASLRICMAGTKSTSRQLREYANWEKEHQELCVVIDEFSARFPDHDIYRDTETGLLIMPSSFSSAMVRSHILTRHKSARIVSYLMHQSVEGFAKPLEAAFSGQDICSVVGGPSDVSQLLSYEMRCLEGREAQINLEKWHLEEV
ncbi:hypothetical protein [Roseibium sp.]|uniref:hypothetical protein n=1 Tax=Roseibium sp. TaxID=1936156 RepID=UPI0039F05162